jgi:hypothetical protein
MRGPAPVATPAEGTIYVIVGSAGADLRPVGADVWTEVSEMSYSAMVLRIRPQMLQATVWREDGSLLDEFTILK